jgi:hypothetical protein
MFNPLLPKAPLNFNPLQPRMQASSIGPKQYGYMLPLLDDASHSQLTVAAACAGQRDWDEKGVTFSILLSFSLNSLDAS